MYSILVLVCSDYLNKATNYCRYKNTNLTGGHTTLLLGGGAAPYAPPAG